MRKWLLIDDDLDDQYIFSLAIKNVAENLELLTAQNGQEGMDLLNGLDAQEKPEIIFLDLNMPLVDGREFLAWIRQQPAYKGIRVLMYTTSSEQKDLEELLALGADAFLTKPNDIGELRDVLKNIQVTYA